MATQTPISAKAQAEVKDGLAQYEAGLDNQIAAGKLTASAANSYRTHARQFTRFLSGEFIPGAGRAPAAPKPPKAPKAPKAEKAPTAPKAKRGRKPKGAAVVEAVLGELNVEQPWGKTSDGAEYQGSCDRCGETLAGEVAEVAGPEGEAQIVHQGCMRQGEAVA